MRWTTPVIVLILLSAIAVNSPVEAGSRYEQAAPSAEAAPVSPALTPPHNAAVRAEGEKKSFDLTSPLNVAGSLALVLGLFLLIVWLLRRASPGRSAVLPAEVFESLGRALLTGRQPVHLLRVGHKLLLVAVGPTDARVLTEISEPAEVERLAALCRRRCAGSVKSSVRPTAPSKAPGGTP